MSVDKRGNTGILVLAIVAIVLGFGVAFVISDSSTPTGYAVQQPTTEITCDPQNNNAECPPGETCKQYGSEYYCGDVCNNVACDFDQDCVNKEFSPECCSNKASFCNHFSNTCECVGPCEESNPCPSFLEGPNSPYCGNVGDCVSTNPFPGEGSAACDCPEEDGCPKGASCSTFNPVNGIGFVNPCGTGHCEITGTSEGGLIGVCVCSKKSCDLGPEGQPDACPDTVQCETGNKCSSHADCGGPGLGSCIEGQCSCKCKSWTPCFSNNDCGVYGEGDGGGDGNYGNCVPGPDGALECMCTDKFGCSPQDCEVGKTPCTGDPEDCGGDGENCNDDICTRCGDPCDFSCDGGACSDDSSALTQEDCNSLSAQLGTACKLDNGDCLCDGIPFDLCRRCYGTGSSTSCGE